MDIKGLYNKFVVQRTDGSSEPGRKHANCEYFVIDLTHDPSLATHVADACESTRPVLARDLRSRLNKEAVRWEAKLAALRAPVDVDGMLRSTLTEDDAEGLAREAIELFSTHGCETVQSIMDVLVKADARAREAMRPHAARLAREAEGLRAEVYRLNAARVMAEEALDRGRKWHEKRTADLDAARAELAKVVLERDAMAERLRAELEAARDPVDGPEAKLAERTAEIERLRADIAHETARRDDQIAQLEQRLGERETEATQYRVAASRAAEVLRTVEWSGVADGGDPGPEPGGCPCCGADKPGPHASTCTLDACLVGSPCADTAALWRVLALARGAIASDEGFTDADLGRTVAQAAEQLRALGHDPDDIWIEPSDAEPITPRGQP